MILEFTIANFRSIRESTTFSMVAEPSKARPENITVHQLANDDNVRLLNSAVIYGPNGSGKSNVMRAFFNLLKFIQRNDSKAGNEIEFYDPFLFNVATGNMPVDYFVSFIGPGKVKYHYCLKFEKNKITREKLSYFPKVKEVLLFDRMAEGSGDALTHIGKLGNTLGNREVKVFHNRLLLSKFGEDDASEELLTDVFVHFRKYVVVNSHIHVLRSQLRGAVNKQFYDDADFNRKLNELIKRSDIKINKLEIRPVDENGLQDNEEVPDTTTQTMAGRNKFSLFGVHDLYDGSNKIGERRLPFGDESRGTNSLYALGGMMIATLDEGGCLFVDELETSFHPELSRMLVELFHSPVTNPLGAQLVFTTHDVTLLSKSLFRKDQIWFTEKNNSGSTELFSVQVFKEAREDTPFDRWYMAGKFGALPFIDMQGDDTTK